MNEILKRPRRLRKNETLRNLVQETRLSVDDLIMPYFVVDGSGVKNEIKSMPGNYQFSIDNLLKELESLTSRDIKSILLFGIPDKKDDTGCEAYSKAGIVQKAISDIKKHYPNLLVVTDICLCAYTNHGHCGVYENRDVDNDKTLALLSKMALAQAEAGADIVAPSDMMDGRVRVIRKTLDENGFKDLPIMSYSAKYASAFYGPFRDAAESAPQTGDRRTYQMDYSNAEEALREIALDIEEGADIVMVKPALAYLDIIRQVKDRFHVPVAAYNVSGEFSMIKAAAEKGYIDYNKIVMETLTSIKRAGADIIITYFAKEFADRLSQT